MFQNSTLEFEKLQSFVVQKTKKTKIKPGTKIALFGVKFAKSDSHIWNQYPWILQIEKFHIKQKTFQLGTKIVLFRYF